MPTVRDLKKAKTLKELVKIAMEIGGFDAMEVIPSDPWSSDACVCLRSDVMDGCRILDCKLLKIGENFKEDCNG